MNKFHEISEQIKCLKIPPVIFYKKNTTRLSFIKRKSNFRNPLSPPSPEDEDIYKLLTAIQQLDKFIKELQDMQFKVLKQEE